VNAELAIADARRVHAQTPQAGSLKATTPVREDRTALIGAPLRLPNAAEGLAPPGFAGSTSLPDKRTSIIYPVGRFTSIEAR